jgi:hypothetical protein
MPMIGGPRHGQWHHRLPEGSRAIVPTAAWVRPAKVLDALGFPEQIGVVETFYVSRRVILGKRVMPVWVHETLDPTPGVQPKQLADVSGMVLDLLVEAAGGVVVEATATL